VPPSLQQGQRFLDGEEQAFDLYVELRVEVLLRNLPQ
jgi:hypothetical protein